MMTLKLFLCLAPLLTSNGAEPTEPRGVLQVVAIEKAIVVSSVGSDTTDAIPSPRAARRTLDVANGSALIDSDLPVGLAALPERDGSDDDDDDDNDDRQMEDGEDDGDDDEDRDEDERRQGRRGNDGPGNRGPGFGGGGFGPPGGFGGPRGVFGRGGFGGGGFGGTFRGGPGSAGSHEVRVGDSDMDSNRNGKLEQEELDRIPEPVRDMLKARGVELEPGMAADTLHFSFRSETNGNFEEHRTEIHRSGNVQHQPQGPNHFNGPMGPPNIHAASGPHGPAGVNFSNIIFELLDMNHDGNLSRDEFQRLTEAMQKAQHSGPPMHHPMDLPHLRGPQPLHPAPGGDMHPQTRRGIGPGSNDRRQELNRPGDGPRSERPRSDMRGPDMRRPSRPESDSRPQHRPAGDHDDKDDHDDDDHNEDDRNEDHSENDSTEVDSAIVSQPELSGDWI